VEKRPGSHFVARNDAEDSGRKGAGFDQGSEHRENLDRRHRNHTKENNGRSGAEASPENQLPKIFVKCQEDSLVAVAKFRDFFI
jgi:hypothetical protein